MQFLDLGSIKLLVFMMILSGLLIGGTLAINEAKMAITEDFMINLFFI